LVIFAQGYGEGWELGHQILDIKPEKTGGNAAERGGKFRFFRFSPVFAGFWRRGGPAETGAKRRHSRPKVSARPTGWRGTFLLGAGPGKV